MMKKLFFFAVALSTIALVSCKKEYTCECSSYNNGTLVTGSTVSTTAEFKKKSDAESWCNSEITSGTITVKCELK